MKLSIPFPQKLAATLKVCSRHDFFADLIAGLTVGIVALPLAMAFGIASGVKPEAGIYTAVVAGFLISALGGSRMQIGGPTGAFRRHRGRHHRATRAPRAPDDRVNGRCLAAPIAWSGF